MKHVDVSLLRRDDLDFSIKTAPEEERGKKGTGTQAGPETKRPSPPSHLLLSFDSLSTKR